MFTTKTLRRFGVSPYNVQVPDHMPLFGILGANDTAARIAKTSTEQMMMKTLVWDESEERLTYLKMFMHTWLGQQGEAKKMTE